MTIEMYTASELLAKELTEAKVIVPGLLTEGLAILAGKPKIGKSYFILGLALSLAVGGRAFGHLPVERMDVLYAALEDNERRLKKRLRELLGDYEPNLYNLKITHRLKRHDEGLLTDLRELFTRNPNLGLVIIDTLTRIRGRTRTGGTSYDDDSAFLGGLQTLALEYNRCILVIHHTRKALSEDWIDDISGSLGLAGVADTSLLLERKRGSQDGRLRFGGRESEGDWSMKAVNYQWQLVDQMRQDEDERLTPERQAILDLLALYPYGLAVQDIAKELKKSNKAISNLCVSLAKEGYLSTPSSGVYALKPPL
jgi:hypothetical protein